MRWTAGTMNLCIFGAVALGPVIGDVQAQAHAWRPLFWIVAGVSGLALLFVLLTFEDQPPQDHSAPLGLGRKRSQDSVAPRPSSASRSCRRTRC
jgi:predicted MFS family arabinose efflux permease